MALGSRVSGLGVEALGSQVSGFRDWVKRVKSGEDHVGTKPQISRF